MLFVSALIYKTTTAEDEGACRCDRGFASRHRSHPKHTHTHTSTHIHIYTHTHIHRHPAPRPAVARTKRSKGDEASLKGTDDPPAIFPPRSCGLLPRLPKQTDDFPRLSTHRCPDVCTRIDCCDLSGWPRRCQQTCAMNICA